MALTAQIKVCAGVGSKNFFNVSSTLSTTATLKLDASFQSSDEDTPSLSSPLALIVGSVTVGYILPELIINADASGTLNTVISQGSKLNLAFSWTLGSNPIFSDLYTCTNGASTSHLCFKATSTLVESGGIRVALGLGFEVGIPFVASVLFAPNFYFQANEGNVPSADGASCHGVVVGTQPGSWYSLCGGLAFYSRLTVLGISATNSQLVSSQFLKASVAIIPNSMPIPEGCIIGSNRPYCRNLINYLRRGLLGNLVEP